MSIRASFDFLCWWCLIRDVSSCNSIKSLWQTCNVHLERTVSSTFPPKPIYLILNLNFVQHFWHYGLCSDLEISCFSVKVCNFEKVTLYPRGWYSICFSRCSREMVISVSDCSTFATSVWFEVTVLVAACQKSGAMRIDLLSANLNVDWIRAERTWSGPIIKRMKCLWKIGKEWGWSWLSHLLKFFEKVHFDQSRASFHELRNDFVFVVLDSSKNRRCYLA